MTFLEPALYPKKDTELIDEKTLFGEGIFEFEGGLQEWYGEQNKIAHLHDFPSFFMIKYMDQKESYFILDFVGNLFEKGINGLNSIFLCPYLERTIIVEMQKFVNLCSFTNEISNRGIRTEFIKEMDKKDVVKYFCNASRLSCLNKNTFSMVKHEPYKNESAFILDINIDELSSVVLLIPRIDYVWMQQNNSYSMAKYQKINKNRIAPYNLFMQSQLPSGSYENIIVNIGNEEFSCIKWDGNTYYNCLLLKTIPLSSLSYHRYALSQEIINFFRYGGIVFPQSIIIHENLSKCRLIRPGQLIEITKLSSSKHGALCIWKGVSDGKVDAKYIPKLIIRPKKHFRRPDSDKLKIIADCMNSKQFIWSKRVYSYAESQCEDPNQFLTNEETQVTDLPPRSDYDNKAVYRKGEIIVDTSGRFFSIKNQAKSNLYQCISSDNNDLIIPNYLITSRPFDDASGYDFAGFRIMSQDKVIIIKGPFPGKEAIIFHVFRKHCLLVISNDMLWIECESVLLKDPTLICNDIIGEKINFIANNYVSDSYEIVGLSQNGSIVSRFGSDIRIFEFREYRRTWLYEKDFQKPSYSFNEQRNDYYRNFYSSNMQYEHYQPPLYEYYPQQQYINNVSQTKISDVEYVRETIKPKIENSAPSYALPEPKPVEKAEFSFYSEPKTTVGTIVNPNGIPVGCEGIMIDIPEMGASGVINKVDNAGNVVFQLIKGANMEYKSYKLPGNRVSPVLPKIGDLCLFFQKSIDQRGFLEKINDKIAILKDERPNGPIHRVPLTSLYKIFGWEED